MVALFKDTPMLTTKSLSIGAGQGCSLEGKVPGVPAQELYPRMSPQRAMKSQQETCVSHCTIFANAPWRSRGETARTGWTIHGKTIRGREAHALRCTPGAVCYDLRNEGWDIPNWRSFKNEHKWIKLTRGVSFKAGRYRYAMLADLSASTVLTNSFVWKSCVN